MPGDWQPHSSGHARILFMTNTLTAKLQTNRGTVTVRLFPDHAPKTVQNFVDLAEGSREWTDPRNRKPGGKLYDGTIFHRVIPNFMIQGRDPLGQGTGGPGYKFADEFHPDLTCDRPYLLAMANSGPGTTVSSRFITGVATPWLNRKHTIFGEVIDGTEVIDEISKVETGRNDRPVRDVVLESVVLELAGKATGAPGSRAAHLAAGRWAMPWSPGSSSASTWPSTCPSGFTRRSSPTCR